MNPNPAPASDPKILATTLPEQTSGEKAVTKGFTASGSNLRLSRKWVSNRPVTRTLHPRPAAYIAFFVTVFACMAAAATVASTDVPLFLGGF